MLEYAVGFDEIVGEVVGGVIVGCDEIVGLKDGADDGDEDGSSVNLIEPATIFSAAIEAVTVATA